MSPSVNLYRIPGITRYLPIFYTLMSDEQSSMMQQCFAFLRNVQVSHITICTLIMAIIRRFILWYVWGSNISAAIGSISDLLCRFHPVFLALFVESNFRGWENRGKDATIV